MKKLFGASAKMLYRDKQALFWALAFPVIFAVVFGLFDFEQTPEVKIDLVGETASPVYGAMEVGLGSIDTFVVTERGDLGASTTRLDDGDTDVVVAVQGSGVEVAYNETNFQTNQFAITAIERIVDRVNLEAAGVSEPMLHRPVDRRCRLADEVDLHLRGLLEVEQPEHDREDHREGKRPEQRLLVPVEHLRAGSEQLLHVPHSLRLRPVRDRKTSSSVAGTTCTSSTSTSFSLVQSRNAGSVSPARATASS